MVCEFKGWQARHKECIQSLPPIEYIDHTNHHFSAIRRLEFNLILLLLEHSINNDE